MMGFSVRSLCQKHYLDRKEPKWMPFDFPWELLNVSLCIAADDLNLIVVEYYVGSKEWLTPEKLRCGCVKLVAY